MEFKKVVKFVRELCYGPDPAKADEPTLILAVPLPKAVAPVFLKVPPKEIEVVLETTDFDAGKAVAKVTVKKPAVPARTFADKPVKKKKAQKKAPGKAPIW